MTFEKELEQLINRHSIESESDTPDFILAQFVRGCLTVFSGHVRERDKWYGRGELVEKKKLTEPESHPHRHLVYLPRTVRGDGFCADTIAPPGVYEAQENGQGAISVKATNGKWLGVKPGEYTEA